MDHLRIPFNITNQIEHPTRPNYLVFHFKKEESANEFEKELKNGNFFYERATQDEDDGSVRHLFGVRKSDLNEIEVINYAIIGKYREPFIKDKKVRYAVVGFGILLVILAILGAVLN